MTTKLPNEPTIVSHDSSQSDHHSGHGRAGIIALSVGALGIVFGDLGTSPLYAFNELFLAEHALDHTRADVLGAVSLVLWAITIVISIKYILLILRADHEGEGGVLALFSRLKPHTGKAVAVTTVFLVFAGGLLFGDGVITPAISVLSAVEGLRVVTPVFNSWVLPITIAILTSLFAIQSRGTNKIGKLFGPIMVVWFIVLGLIGANQLANNLDVLHAFNPMYAVRVLGHLGIKELAVTLGAVMLVITGGEAIYADLGHFGKRPIRMAWFSIAYPALMLNYLGQGAFVLSGQEIKSSNIFFSTVPSAALDSGCVSSNMCNSDCIASFDYRSLFVGCSGYGAWPDPPLTGGTHPRRS